MKLRVDGDDVGRDTTEEAQFSRRLKATSVGTALNSVTAATMTTSTTPINGNAQGYLPYAVSAGLHSSFDMLAN